MAETWRVSALHPLYRVCSDGRVERIWAGAQRCYTKPLKPYAGRDNYLKVQLGYRGPRVYVHTLVALTFLGPRPRAHHVDHIDFDKTNNAVANLRYLPAAVNSVRWAGRRDGKNVWALVRDEPVPDDHTPMSQEEHDATYAELAAGGW